MADLFVEACYRPQDFEMETSESPMDRSVTVKIRSKDTGEVAWRRVEGDSPELGLLRVAWHNSFTAIAKSQAMIRQQMIYQAKYESLKKKYSGLLATNLELKGKLEEAGADPMEYASVEGWDEF